MSLVYLENAKKCICFIWQSILNYAVLAGRSVLDIHVKSTLLKDLSSFQVLKQHTVESITMDVLQTTFSYVLRNYDIENLVLLSKVTASSCNSVGFVKSHTKILMSYMDIQ